jgi:hypothetical protein
MNTLEIYNSVYDWPALLTILKSTTFPRLTDLELDYHNLRGDKVDIPYFLPHIKNAPSLKRLTLRYYAIDLEFLEQAHASCPQLESLRLAYSHIVIRKPTLNQPIVPADSLLSLKIEDGCSFDTNGLFLEYIAKKKYRCLNHLRLSFEEDFDNYNFQRFYGGKSMCNYADNPKYNVENESDPEIRGIIQKEDDCCTILT